MTLRLRVVEAAWQAKAKEVAAQYGSVVPVVKGTGYGFGRQTLMPLATTIATEYGDGFIAVGSVYEAQDVPDGMTAMVLTPHLGELPVTLSRDSVLTVGSKEQVDALAAQRWSCPVVVKIKSSMHRHGTPVKNSSDLVAYANANGLNVIGFSFHPPLENEENDNFEEVCTTLAQLAPNATVFLSHLSAKRCSDVQTEFPSMTLSIRVGTGLWHADKTLMQLSTNVLSIESVNAGDQVGYHRVECQESGVVIVVGTGSANGVAPLANGLSPFHFAKRRLTLLENPHMHTSMVFIPEGSPTPQVGEYVDVQRPLITTTVDELVWTTPGSK